MVVCILNRAIIFQRLKRFKEDRQSFDDDKTDKFHLPILALIKIHPQITKCAK